MVFVSLIGTLTSVSETLINPYSGEELIINGDYYMNTTLVTGSAGAGDVLGANPFAQYWRVEDENGNPLITDFELLVPSSGDDILNFASLTNISGDLSIQVADGNDIVWSGAGNDNIGGSVGDDILHGGPGNDIINGQADNDTLTGGSGDDTIDGGDGYDIAIYHQDYANYTLVDNAGTLTITDTVGDEGVDSVTTVEKVVFADGFYEGGVFTSTAPEPDPFLTFTAGDFESYTKQDDAATAAIAVVNDTELQMSGNTWKALDLDYVVTGDSYVTFDYRTDVEGEVQGLIFLRDGLDPSNTGTWNLHSESEFIRLDGTQSYNGSENLYTDESGDWQTITVKLSDYNDIGSYIGHLVFVNDDDADASGMASFRNVTVFELDPVVVEIPDNAPVLNFAVGDFESYTKQDDAATAAIAVVNDTELQMSGNTWKALDFDYVVTGESYVTFEYNTEAEGELTGLIFLRDGLDPSNTGTWNLHQESEFIHLDGDQNYNGFGGFYDDGLGGWQTITVKLSDFNEIGAEIDHLVFVNDDDADASGASSFRNIQVFENNGIYGDSGDNTVQGTSDADYLYGNDGADVFLFESVNAFEAVDTIGDFDMSEGDVLDVSDLLSGYDSLSDAISDFVQITDNGSDSVVSVDIDGGGDNFVQVATIYGIMGITNEADLETSGVLITQ